VAQKSAFCRPAHWQKTIGGGSQSTLEFAAKNAKMEEAQRMATRS
jgi:hypothetical protein